MNSIRRKFKRKSLESTDIDFMISTINDIISNERKGCQNLSEDDVQNLEIIKQLLIQYLKKNRSVHFQANSKMDYNKTRIIVNELSLNQIIGNSVSGMGGTFWFEIIDLNRFRDYLYKLIELILEKIPKGIRFKEPIKIFLKRFFSNPWVIGIGCTVIGGIILALIISQ